MKPELWDRYFTWRSHFVQRGLVFVHIPKTSGTSVADAIYGDKKSQHYPANELFRDPELRHLSSFSVVRNPYARLLSAYNYLRTGGNPGIQRIDDNEAWSRLLRQITFLEFLDLLCKHYEGRNVETKSDLAEVMHHHGAKDLVMFTPQHRFIYQHDASNRWIQMVDSIYTMETLSRNSWELNLGDAFGTIKIRHLNPTSQRSVVAYTEDAAAKVYKLYANDFTLLNYAEESWKSLN